GSFAPTWIPTTQRLDGSSVFDPPPVYGWPAYARYGGFGYGPYGFSSGRSGRVDGFRAAGARTVPPSESTAAIGPSVASPARSVVVPAGGGGVARRRP